MIHVFGLASGLREGILPTLYRLVEQATQNSDLNRSSVSAALLRIQARCTGLVSLESGDGAEEVVHAWSQESGMRPV